MSHCLLLSFYALGHAPLALAEPAAALRQAGHGVTTLDLAVEPLNETRVAAADVLLISAPMHTALTLGLASVPRLRALNPHAPLAFFGLYAWLNADQVLTLADAALANEGDAGLVDWVNALNGRGDPTLIPGARTRTTHTALQVTRPRSVLPDYATLPPLDRYARLDHAGQVALAGYVEASRGCLHTCRHCPITPVYQGRFVVVPRETVLADIRQQVQAGATHIMFGDPDFLNGPNHALALARALHAEFPPVTFDATIKIEHILQHRALFPELAALGCVFVVSAIEAMSDEVLRQLRKGHTVAEIDVALDILDAAGIALHPTLVAFTPWTTLDDYLAQLAWIDARGLQPHIPPIQLAIRLLIPPGSLILDNAGAWLGPLDAPALTYRWQHPDPRMDELHGVVMACVSEHEAQGLDAAQTHAAIRAIAYHLAGRPLPKLAVAQRPAPPRLTENWFC
jgi:radical SAM superfamily enzyme YgiQ (UPF0313 family)